MGDKSERKVDGHEISKKYLQEQHEEEKYEIPSNVHTRYLNGYNTRIFDVVFCCFLCIFNFYFF